MAEKRDYSEITPEIQALAAHCSEDCVIDKELYTKYKGNRGLRDLNGNGVLTGLTEISEIQAKTPRRRELRRLPVLPGLQCARSGQRLSEGRPLWL